MAHVIAVTWRCDRCDRPVQLPEGERPPNWKTVKSDTGAEWELCEGCYDQFSRFMAGHRPPEANPTRPPEETSERA